MDRGYIAQNDEQRARLRAIVSRCTDADLTRPMPGGWTVAAVLLHAAFWDQRIAVLIERWRTTGAAPLPEDPIDVEWINDGMKPMLLAVPARKAAEMAVEIAESVDRLVAELPDEWVDRVVAANVISLVRADHRREHLDEIEDVLKR